MAKKPLQSAEGDGERSFGETEDVRERSASHVPHPTLDELDEQLRAADEVLESKELAFARRALDALPSLSSEQVEALRKRIESGYYTNPEVVKAISERLVELFGRERGKSG